MQFRVVASRDRDIEHAAGQARAAELTPLGAASNTRQVSLNEVDSEVPPRAAPAHARRSSAR